MWSPLDAEHSLWATLLFGAVALAAWLFGFRPRASFALVASALWGALVLGSHGAWARSHEWHSRAETVATVTAILTGFGAIGMVLGGAIARLTRRAAPRALAASDRGLGRRDLLKAIPAALPASGVLAGGARRSPSRTTLRCA
jgi:hypothetical protein